MSSTDTTLFEPFATDGCRARCTVVVQRHAFGRGATRLRRALTHGARDDRIAYAIPLDTPLFERLMTVITLRWQLRLAERTMTRGGTQIVGRFGVDPTLSAPACVYELNSAASVYADRCLRFSRPAGWLRRLAARCIGCDPGLGAVLIVGRKT